MHARTLHISAIGLFLIFLIQGIQAQPSFTILKNIPATAVKDQDNSGTCWSFATVSFIESELIRKGRGETDLSEMYFVRKAYEEKADKYVRLHGKANFGEGGLAMDVLYLWKKYGALPESAYHGQTWGRPLPDHKEMDSLLKSYAKTVAGKPGEELSPVWKNGFNGILDAYLGPLPGDCRYQGEPVDAEEFAAASGFDPDEYVAIGSFLHHPFYGTFPLEIPDNWLWSAIYNVPLEEMMEVLDHALETGFSVCWDTDIGEMGFSSKAGLAMIPVYDVSELDPVKRDQWEQLSTKWKRKLFYDFFKPGLEVSISQQLRQDWFDNRKTTDDHLMHITGIAKDQHGKRYYRVKNSWGKEDQPYDGYLYVSENYMRAQTIFFMVHKDAVPAAIAQKLGI